MLYISWGCKFSFVLGFNFHRYWEGDLYLHLTWCTDEVRKKIWLMDGIIRSNIQRAIAFTNDHSALQAWKVDDILLIVCSKYPVMQSVFINTFLSAWWILEITKPYRSTSKDDFNTIAGRRGLEWGFKSHNWSAIQNTLTSNDFINLVVLFPPWFFNHFSAWEKRVYSSLVVEINCASYWASRHIHLFRKAWGAYGVSSPVLRTVHEKMGMSRTLTSRVLHIGNTQK